MGRYYWLLIPFILSFALTNAQDNVVEHSIQKGETVYGISRQYGTSMESVFALNPGSREVIYTGDTLQIPKNGTTAATINSTSNTTNTSNNIKYLVVRGDTKSGLSRTYGVSIASLEQQNPQIVPMLMAGHVLTINKNYKVRNTAKNGEHFVNKGETLWGIAKANGISVNALIAANKNRLEGVLKAGQTLLIPEKNSALTSSGDYIVKPGDTKWGLSKKFNMTIAELERRNPQIVTMLMAGHRLTIDGESNLTTEEQPKVSPVNEIETAPVALNEEEALENAVTSDSEITLEDNPVASNPISEETETEVQAVTPSEGQETLTERTTVTDSIPDETLQQEASTTTDSAYMDYVIQPKETLYGLSKKAGMSMEDFTTLNPQLLNGVASGAVIKVPKNKGVFYTGEKAGSSTSATSEVIGANPNEKLYYRLDKGKKTALYLGLPFSKEAYQNGSISADATDQESQQLQKHIDFYQGALMAIDSAQTLGLNFEVSLLEKSASGRFSRLKPDTASEENAVIIPFLKSRESYPKVTSKNPTAIIGVGSDSNTSDENLVYDALPSQLELKTRTLNYIAHKNAQIVVVSDLEEARNKDLIRELVPTAQFLKVDRTGFFEGKGLESVLAKDKLNYIILDTDRTIVFLNATTEFMGKLSDYKIEMVLIESASLPKPGQVSDMRFRILKLIFPSMLPIEKPEALLQFERAYTSRFQVEASENAIIGFDTTLDVLLRLAQSTGFENSAALLKSQQLLLKFQYQKINDNRFENKGIYLLQYADGNTVIEID